MSDLNENSLAYVKHVLKETGLAPSALAEKVGLSTTTLTRPLYDPEFKFAISSRTLAKIEAKTGISMADFLAGKTGDSSEIVRARGGLVPTPIIATVEAGAWREVDEFDQSEPDWLPLPPDRDFPNATQEVYNVSGSSMNALKPFPILPGSKIVVLRYDDIASRYPLRDGLIVVVQRTRGQTRELSVKQVAWFDDRIEFQPRSTDPKHKPIVVTHDDWEDNGVVVEILGLVRSTINEMPR